MPGIKSRSRLCQYSGAKRQGVGVKSRNPTHGAGRASNVLLRMRWLLKQPFRDSCCSILNLYYVIFHLHDQPFITADAPRRLKLGLRFDEGNGNTDKKSIFSIGMYIDFLPSIPNTPLPRSRISLNLFNFESTVANLNIELNFRRHYKPSNIHSDNQRRCTNVEEIIYEH